jgi:hypothetical protein
MTAVGCDTVEVNPPQHSIKQREKCGLTLSPDIEVRNSNFDVFSQQLW